MKDSPLVSIIIPMRNARQHLLQVIETIMQSSYEQYELIVVDDASTDGSAELAHAHGTKVIALEHQAGPAAARNRGAKEARGDILLFVDSDVLIRKETVARIVSDFRKQPGLAAVFGSYDDEPAEDNFLSQYKNLCHHFVHQQSSAEAVTFWAGCGAVRREQFNAVGRFDEKRYSKPSIEDIELGYRMKQSGGLILLDKKLQVKHLKKWNFLNLLRADIFYRAIPWSRLILESGQMVNHLNLQISQRISAGLTLCMVGAAFLSILQARVALLVPVLAMLVCLINYRLYVFLLRKRGINFTIRAIPMQFLYLFYSAVVFGFVQLSKFVANGLKSMRAHLKFLHLETSKAKDLNEHNR